MFIVRAGSEVCVVWGVRIWRGFHLMMDYGNPRHKLGLAGSPTRSHQRWEITKNQFLIS